MHSTPFPGEAYQQAAEYQLGEPIRLYETHKRQHLQAAGWALAGIALLLLFFFFWHNGFRVRPSDMVLYGLGVLIIMIVALMIVLPILRAPRTTVYICTSGFLVLDQSGSEAVRWEEIERVEWRERDSPCRISLVDAHRADIILSNYINRLQDLVEEIELKAQLAKDTEQGEDLEQHYERSKNEQRERQQAGKLLYQTHKQYLATKDPDEARVLGEAFQLGDPLGTYRSGLRGLWQKTTLKHLAWTCVLVLLPVIDPQHGIQPLWPVGCLVGLALFSVFFIVPRVISCNMRLHIYTEGFLFLHSSLDVLRWRQVEKVVYGTGFFSNFCTLHLKNGEKLALSAYLEKQDEIKHMLGSRVAKKEEEKPHSKPIRSRYPGSSGREEEREHGGQII